MGSVHMTFARPEPGKLSFECEMRSGVLLVTGSVPINILAGLCQTDFNGPASLSPDVSRLAQVNLAMGNNDDLEALRLELAAGLRPGLATRYPSFSAAALDWMAFGRIGLSSAAMFKRATGVSPFGFERAAELTAERSPHPTDVESFRRCVALVETVPEASGAVAMMADATPTWGRIAAAWDVLRDTLHEEVPNFVDPTPPFRAPRLRQMLDALTSDDPTMTHAEAARRMALGLPIPPGVRVNAEVV